MPEDPAYPPERCQPVLTGDPVHDAEELEFHRRYGPWFHATPAEAATFMAGFDGPWWVSGGWAIEAFTGVSRPHDDIDVTIFRADVPRLLEHVGNRFHLWSAGKGGALRPVDAKQPELPDWADQVWVRERATGPWLFDVVTNRGTESAWEFKRDPTYVRPLAEVTWVAADGLRYLNPELALAHKLSLQRPKDDIDLTAAVPRLDRGPRDWLSAFIEEHAPDHPWRARFG